MTYEVKRRVFAFNYILKDDSGNILDASEENQPLPFLEGAGQIIPALESVLLLLSEGDKKSVSLEASEAYGLQDPKMVMEVPRSDLSHLKELEVGSFLRLELGDRSQMVRVTHIGDEKVTLDGNHPLAGLALHFDVEMVLVREATDDEVTHGHAHGLHGSATH